MSASQQPELPIISHTAPSGHPTMPLGLRPLEDLRKLLDNRHLLHSAEFANFQFAGLPHERIVQFATLLTRMLHYLPDTLPPMFTAAIPQNPALPPDFDSKVRYITEVLSMTYSVLITVTQLGLSSQELNNDFFFYMIDYLNHNMFTGMGYPIPARLDTPQTASSPFPPTQPYSTLDLWILQLVMEMLEIYSMMLDMVSVLRSVPRYYYTLLFTQLSNFFQRFQEFVQPWIPRDDNLEAENNGSEVLNDILVINEATSNAVGEPVTCFICLEDMNDRHIVRRLRCSHIYHVDCIGRWLESRQTCPYCRTSIRETNV